MAAKQKQEQQKAKPVKNIDRGDAYVYGRKYDIIEAAIIATEFETLGDCNYEFARIRIRQDIPVDSKFRVLIHELSHAALYENGLNDLYTKDQIEGICNFVTHMYCSVLPDNQKALDLYRNIK